MWAFPPWTSHTGNGCRLMWCWAWFLGCLCIYSVDLFPSSMFSSSPGLLNPGWSPVLTPLFLLLSCLNLQSMRGYPRTLSPEKLRRLAQMMQRNTPDLPPSHFVNSGILPLPHKIFQVSQILGSSLLPGCRYCNGLARLRKRQRKSSISHKK